MPRYEWRGASPFRDHRNDRVIEPGETVEIDERVAGPQPEFVEVEDGGGGEAAADETADESTTGGYTRDELESMDYAKLRSLASDADTDAVDGKSAKDEIIDALAE